MTDITHIDITTIVKQKPDDMTKRGNGTLLCLCGSTYYRGAAFMAVNAALRSGVGIVRLASTETVIQNTANSLHECVFLPLKDEYGIIGSANADTVLEYTKNSNAFLIGCGLSLCDETRKLVKKIIPKVNIPAVIDADALNVVSEDPGILKKMNFSPIITPHYAEMARLCHVGYEDVKRTPIAYATSFAQQYGIFVVLKGTITHIATPDGEIYENNYPNPGLSKGGSGDILAGTVASFLAQGYTQTDAAIAGVAVHSRAARLCLADSTPNSMLPTDILQYYPLAFAGEDDISAKK